MAELTTLARPYAKAAFEYARDAKTLTEWDDLLKQVAGVTLQPKIAGLLASPSYTTDQLADTFIGLCGEEISPAFASLVRVLAKNKRLPLLPQISEQFRSMKAELERTVEVELISAFELNPMETEILAKSLGTRLERKVTIRSRVDTSLLGGVIIRAGDMVIDGSARGRLAKLAEAINH